MAKTIRQKTLKNYFDYLDPVFEVGEEVVLVERYSESTGRSTWVIRRAPQGIGGNLDPQAKRFHGWRGTTDGISITAHGLRRVIKVSQHGEPCEYGSYQRVTVGPDLRPDLA